MTMEKNKIGLISLAIVLVLAVLTGVMAGFANTHQSSIPNALRPSIGATVVPSDLGNEVTLAQATSSVTFEFHVPQSVPPGTTLSQVIVSKDNTIVRLFYNSTTLPDAHAFGGSLPFPAALVIYYEATPSNPINALSGIFEPIIVQIQHIGQNARTVQTIQQQPVGTPVLVCGVSGLTQVASPYSGATLAWWSNGVLHIISADVSTPQLLQIANSMC